MGLSDKDMPSCENLPKIWQVTNSGILNLFLLTFLEIEG